MSTSPQHETVASYQQLPYESIPHYESHPDRIAAIAYLSGLEPSRLENCRVLELGCASGGNLLGLAEVLPGATFVGIDLAANQIAEGRATVEQLGLKNVRLEAMSLLDLPPDFGQFDFIIAQGLFTWVPADVQHRIFDVCKWHLSPNGVAYISYDTLPGWRMRGVTRELLLFGLETLPADTDPRTRLDTGMNFAVTLARAAGDQSNYARALRADVESILRAPPWYVAHEYLDADHSPCYFRDFVAMAVSHGLGYVGDARQPMAAGSVAQALRAARPELAAGDPIRFEQCVDFAFGRQFRRSLLCHAGQPVRLQMDAARLTRCGLNANVFPTEQTIDLRPQINATFRSPDGTTAVTLDDPVAKIALTTLAEAFPLSASFDALWDRARAALNLPANSDAREHLAQVMLQFVAMDAVDPSLTPSTFVRQFSARPVASPVARWQASTGRLVHTRRHRLASSLDRFDRSVLSLLDGTRDGPALRAALIAGGHDAATVDQALGQSLQKLAANALLIG